VSSQLQQKRKFLLRLQRQLIKKKKIFKVASSVHLFCPYSYQKNGRKRKKVESGRVQRGVDSHGNPKINKFWFNDIFAPNMKANPYFLRGFASS
jgi:hypothetical protein